MTFRETVLLGFSIYLRDFGYGPAALAQAGIADPAIDLDCEMWTVLPER
jgi:hypothetical protein